MAVRSKPPEPASQPPGAVGSLLQGEHIYIESEDAAANPAATARTLRETVHLRNPLRHTGAELALYEEGFLKVTKLNQGNADEPFYLDLRFVDPVPKFERVIAVRWLTSAVGFGTLAALAAFLMRFDAFYAMAIAGFGGASLASALAFYVGLYRSYERIEFSTLHGRVAVLKLTANIGVINKHRAFVLTLSRAIEGAAERIGIDTSAYLRAEMREHYRLRGGGVIDNDECAEGTGRILAQFDVQL